MYPINLFHIFYFIQLLPVPSKQPVFSNLNRGPWSHADETSHIAPPIWSTPTHDPHKTPHAWIIENCLFWLFKFLLFQFSTHQECTRTWIRGICPIVMTDVSWWNTIGGPLVKPWEESSFMESVWSHLEGDWGMAPRYMLFCVELSTWE